MSTLNSNTVSTDYSDDDETITSFYTAEDDDHKSILSTPHRRSNEYPRAIFLGALAVTLLVLSLVAIAWKKSERQGVQPDVSIPELKSGSAFKEFASGAGIGDISGHITNSSSLARTKQLLHPRQRAFAGAPTTEFSMMEIADINFESMRLRGGLPPTTSGAPRREVNVPFREEVPTFRWRAAVVRRDVAVTTKPPWDVRAGVSETRSSMPNLVRRFVGRRRLPVYSSSSEPSISPSITSTRVSSSSFMEAVSPEAVSAESSASNTNLPEVQISVRSSAITSQTQRRQATKEEVSSIVPVTSVHQRSTEESEILPFDPIFDLFEPIFTETQLAPKEDVSTSLPLLSGNHLAVEEIVGTQPANLFSPKIERRTSSTLRPASSPTNSSTVKPRLENDQLGIGRVVPLFDFDEPVRDLDSGGNSRTFTTSNVEPIARRRVSTDHGTAVEGINISSMVSEEQYTSFTSLETWPVSVKVPTVQEKNDGFISSQGEVVGPNGTGIESGIPTIVTEATKQNKITFDTKSLSRDSSDDAKWKNQMNVGTRKISDSVRNENCKTSVLGDLKSENNCSTGFSSTSSEAVSIRNDMSSGKGVRSSDFEFVGFNVTTVALVRRSDDISKGASVTVLLNGAALRSGVVSPKGTVLTMGSAPTNGTLFTGSARGKAASKGASANYIELTNLTESINYTVFSNGILSTSESAAKRDDVSMNGTLLTSGVVSSNGTLLMGDVLSTKYRDLNRGLARSNVTVPSIYVVPTNGTVHTVDVMVANDTMLKGDLAASPKSGTDLTYSTAYYEGIEKTVSPVSSGDSNATQGSTGNSVDELKSPPTVPSNFELAAGTDGKRRISDDSVGSQNYANRKELEKGTIQWRSHSNISDEELTTIQAPKSKQERYEDSEEPTKKTRLGNIGSYNVSAPAITGRKDAAPVITTAAYRSIVSQSGRSSLIQSVVRSTPTVRGRGIYNGSHNYSTEEATVANSFDVNDKLNYKASFMSQTSSLPSKAETSSTAMATTTRSVEKHITERRGQTTRRRKYRRRYRKRTARMRTMKTASTNGGRNEYEKRTHVAARRLTRKYSGRKQNKRTTSSSRRVPETTRRMMSKAVAFSNQTESSTVTKNGTNNKFPFSEADITYQPKIKAVEITHRHNSRETTGLVSSTDTTLVPLARTNTLLHRSSLNKEGRQTIEDNDSAFGNAKFQHAPLNVWPRKNEASRLQKEHPAHRRKERSRVLRRIGNSERYTATTSRQSSLQQSTGLRVSLSSTENSTYPENTSSPFPTSVPTSMPQRNAPEVRSHVPSSMLQNNSFEVPTSFFSSLLRTNTFELPTSVSSSMLQRNTFDFVNETTPEPIVFGIDLTQRSPGETSSNLSNVTIISQNVTEMSFTRYTAQDLNFSLVVPKDVSASLPARTTENALSGKLSTAASEANINFNGLSIGTSSRPTFHHAALMSVEDAANAVHCTNADCIEEGQRLHAHVDWTYQPCASFYDYSCGGWIRTHPFPSNRKKLSVDDLIVEIAEQKTMEFLYENVQHIASYTDPLLHNAIRLFQGCSDKSSLMKNPALSIQAALDEIHLSEWPYDEEPLDLEIPEVLALAARKLGVHPFFVSSLEVDTTTPSGWIFVFKEPRTVIPGDAYLFEDFPVKYQKLVTKAMSFVNSDKNIQAMSEPVVEVDHEVFKILEKTKHVTDYTVEYFRKKLAQVNKKKDFDLGLFLTSLMSDITVLDSDTEFVEAAPNLLQHVQNLTASFNKIAVLNYVGFRALLSLSPLLPHNDGRDLAHLLYVREIPTRTSSKRWKFCIRLLENVYKLPLLQLQAESFEKKDMFQTINRTVELLKKYFFRQVRNSSLFGHETKDIVINKLRLLKMECFNSHHISNHEARERHYHGVPDIDPANVLSDYTQTLIVVLQNYWSSYGGTGSVFRWHGSIFDTEATYDHFDNTLYIPMAVFMEDVKYNTFHSPLYFPRSGRRIMEALYTMIERDASFFGRNNEVTASSYWDYVTLNGYLSLRRCLKKQFRKTTPSHFTSNLMNAPNPSMKLSQDVKDNAVLQIVLEAFREAMLDFGYKPGGLVLPEFTETTTDQLFFLLYSTSYCEVTTQEAQMADDVSSTSHPRRSRVNLSLRNIPAFATAFACTNVTEMNPTKKCRSW